LLRAGLLAGCWAGLALLLIISAPAKPAAADNCQDFSDCFATANSASDALLGLTFLGMLSMALNFVPYVGTAKGIIEAITGHDLLTGEKLTLTDRLLGLIPGGLGKEGKLARLAEEGEDLSRLGRLGREGDELGDLARMGGRNADELSDAERAAAAAERERAPVRPGEEPPREPGGGGKPPEEPPRNPPPTGGEPPEPPRRTPRGEEPTGPSREPSPDHQAGGTPEKVPTNSTPANAENIRIQNANADRLAQEGYDIQHGVKGEIDPVTGKPGTADYRIDGKAFDSKVASTDNTRNFVDRLESSASKYNSNGTQADRFVVDLDHGPMTPEALRAELLAREAARPGMGLSADSAIQEVIAIKDGQVIHLFP
jgi:hypothetical protein